MGSEVAVTRVEALPSTHPGMMDELNYDLNIELQRDDSTTAGSGQLEPPRLGPNMG